MGHAGAIVSGGKGDEGHQQRGDGEDGAQAHPEQGPAFQAGTGHGDGRRGRRDHHFPYRWYHHHGWGDEFDRLQDGVRRDVHARERNHIRHSIDGNRQRL